MNDTIYAPATAPGRAAVAVVRISGPQTSTVLRALCGRLPPPRRFSVRKLRAAGEVLDESAVIWLPGPASFTGEDAGELHTHGGSAVVSAVCRALAAAGARIAEPGEFTRRAFEAGRLDLTQAEAIADLVDAETEAQRRQAAAQLSGALTERHRGWRDRLLDALAMIEAGIDFPEDDVPGGMASQALDIAREVRTELKTQLRDQRGERTRAGLRIALVGAPNVGKSSLLNALAGRDAAIVTPLEGTTRDVIEVHLVWDGYPVILTDTAGLRETADLIEAEGIARARRSATQADIRLAIADAARPETIEQAAQLLESEDILIVNKVDLDDRAWRKEWPSAIGVSARNEAFQDLKAEIGARVRKLSGGADFPAITRERHRAVLESCVDSLSRLTATAGHIPAELVGEDLRLALRALGRLEGRGDPEAVLDRVFSSFCIGK